MKMEKNATQRCGSCKWESYNAYGYPCKFCNVFNMDAPNSYWMHYKDAKDDRMNVYQRAIMQWGDNHQAIVAIEELSELQKELCKYLRGNKNVTNLIEEIADVEIVVEQLKIMFDCSQSVDEWKERKLERLEKKMEE